MATKKKPLKKATSRQWPLLCFVNAAAKGGYVVDEKFKYDRLVGFLLALEGKKRQVDRAQMRETIGILSDLIIAQAKEGDLTFVFALLRNGLQRSAAGRADGSIDLTKKQAAQAKKKSVRR